MPLTINSCVGGRAVIRKWELEIVILIQIFIQSRHHAIFIAI